MDYDQKKRAGSDQLLETMVLATTALLQPIFINATLELVVGMIAMLAVCRR